MSRIATGIVAHQSRVEQAECLAEQVGAVICNVDDGTLQCAGNHGTVLSLLVCADADWVVCLEDDAEPVPGFAFHLQQALAHTPAPIVGLYLGTGNPSGQPQRQIRQAVLKADVTGAAWILGDCLIGSVGYVIRSSLIPDLLGALPEEEGEYPLRVSRWAQRWELPVAYTIPSLVNHADDDPVGHPVGQLRSTRRAWMCGSREDWDTGAVELGRCDGWSSP